MAPTMWADAVTRLGRLCGPGGDPPTDAELLRRFARDRDQEAFRALVHRHGPLVWGVAARHAADRHAAEDAFQATFFALARLADRLHGDRSLAGWLHTVAVRTARRTRRRIIPQPDAPEPVAHATDPLDALSARELLAVLDEEIGRLPARFRQPVLLCCLEGLSRDEAAARLGWSVGSLKGRLERGRELLRRRLAARGVGLAALAVSPVTVPGPLSAAATEAAIRYAAGPIEGTAAALAGEVVRAAAWRRWGAIVAAVGLVAAAVGGIGVTLRAAPAPADDPPKPAAAKPAEDDPDGPLVRVLAGGKPVAGAKVWTFPEYFDPENGKLAPETPPVVTGADGTARLPARTDIGPGAVAVFARDPAGRVGCNHFYMYHPPEGIAVHLVETTELTGRFVDPDGRPLPGVEVSAWHVAPPEADKPEDGPRTVYALPPWEAERSATKTGADGRFSFPGVPVKNRIFLRVKTAGLRTVQATVSADEPATLTLARAGAVRVKFTGDGVADTRGMPWTLQPEPGPKPPPDQPKVFLSTYSTGKFDGSAEYVISELLPGTYTFHCSGGGSIPVLPKAPEKVEVKPGETAEVTVPLTRLTKVTGRVVEAETGKPVPGVEVLINPPDPVPDYPLSYVTVPTDADGRYVAYLSPGYTVMARPQRLPDGYLEPEFKRGQLPTPDVKLTADGHTCPDIKLRKGVTFTATVADADGKPVRATVYPALIDHRFAFRDSLTAKADGTFSLPNMDPQDLIAPRARRGNAVNIPKAVDIGGKDGPATITVSEENACRLAGRVTDARGKPVAGATVSVQWHYWGVGKSSSTGTSRVVETLTTDADGRYRSSGYWPTDKYMVSVTASGYGRGETEQVVGVAGKTHDLPDVRLVRSGLAVRGVVVDLAGKPVAGATVFNRGDGEKEMETTTDAEGRFNLAGFRDGPAFVLARKEGHRMAAVPADPGGEPVRVVLRKSTDPPVEPPPLADHNKAVDKVTRHLLTALWAERARLGGYERTVFDNMARYDPAAARKWADEAGGNFPARLAKAEQARKQPDVAKADPDEALARLADRKGRDGFDAIYALARKLLPTDKKAAARVAEEAVVRARALDMPQRAWSLAAAGFLAARAGNVDGGKAVVVEAAGLAETLPADEQNGFYRGYVAGYLAPFDRPRAEKMLAAHKDPDDYNRYLALAIDRVAAFDPEAARGMLDGFRSGNGFYQHVGRSFLAYRLAAKDPDGAAKLIAGVTEPHYRAMGYVTLARVVARTDRPRAWALIDAALAQLEKDSTGFDSWSGFGGWSAVAAVVASAARDLGHPDPSAGVVLALARRPIDQSTLLYRDRQLVSIALTLSFVDPPAARRVLAAVAPPDRFAEQAATSQRDWVFAVALVLPEHAPAVIDQRLKQFLGRGAGREGVSGSGLIELTDTLIAADRYRDLARWASLPRANSEWEV